jgi:hypothetical protein
VTGAALDNYLSDGYGITITKVSSNVTPSVVSHDTPAPSNGPLAYASSPPNFFDTQNSDNNSYSFEVNFATPLNSFSFTRCAENGNGLRG